MGAPAEPERQGRLLLQLGEKARSCRRFASRRGSGAGPSPGDTGKPGWGESGACRSLLRFSRALFLLLPHASSVLSPPLKQHLFSWAMGLTILGMILFLPYATTCLAVKA